MNWRVEPEASFPVVTNIHRPSITPYIPAKDKSTGAAVIIAPGGGHMFLSIDHEVMTSRNIFVITASRRSC